MTNPQRPFVWIFISISFTLFPLIGVSQGTPDSRICNCFAEPVPANFMNGTKAVYGTVGIFLSSDTELPPKQSEPVRFTVPLIRSKQGCQSWYSIFITDELNRKVFESAGTSNEISYSFPDCERTYHVVLMAYSKSANSGDGNCSRRLNFRVKPKCNSKICDCSPDSKSAPYSINAEVKCLGRELNLYKHVLKFGITNKSDCLLSIHSISMMNQTIEVPSNSIGPKGNLTGLSLGFNVNPEHTLQTFDVKVNTVILYSLNGRKCTEQIDLKYAGCITPVSPLPAQRRN